MSKVHTILNYYIQWFYKGIVCSMRTTAQCHTCNKYPDVYFGKLDQFTSETVSYIAVGHYRRSGLWSIVDFMEEYWILKVTRLPQCGPGHYVHFKIILKHNKAKQTHKNNLNLKNLNPNAMAVTWSNNTHKKNIIYSFIGGVQNTSLLKWLQ